MENNEIKNESFYKQKWFIVISILLTILILVGISLAIALPLSNKNNSNNEIELPIPFDANASYTLKTDTNSVDYEEEMFYHHNDPDYYPDNEIDYALGMFNTFAFAPFIWDVFGYLNYYNDEGKPGQYYHRTDILNGQTEQSSISFDYEFYLSLRDINGVEIENIDHLSEVDQISLLMNFSNVDISYQYLLKDAWVEDWLGFAEYPIWFYLTADYFEVELDYFISKNTIIYDIIDTNFKFVTYESLSFDTGRYCEEPDFISWTLAYDFNNDEFLMYGIQMFSESWFQYNHFAGTEKIGFLGGFDSRDFEDNSAWKDFKNWYIKQLNPWDLEYDHSQYLDKSEWIWIFDINDPYIHFVE